MVAKLEVAHEVTIVTFLNSGGGHLQRLPFPFTNLHSVRFKTVQDAVEDP